MSVKHGKDVATAALLVRALARPGAYPHAVAKVGVIETHISWVFLTGSYAYKVKKPVNLGFVDFTTLAARHHYCEEEVRLNRRLAPDIYLGVVAIRNGATGPRVGGKGTVLEYAVKMREFAQTALAARMLASKRLTAAHIDQLADCIAAFHAAVARAPACKTLGSAEVVHRSALQNFEQISPELTFNADRKALNALLEWTKHDYRMHAAELRARKIDGHVRECHGDLHLGNVAVIDDKPVPFDCIEFNEELRWIDVISEIAFLIMDLRDRRRDDLAWRFLNRYLESTGDYQGLPLLPYYLVYRALVRAKVHLLRALQPGLGARKKSRLTLAFRDYVRLAQRYTALQQTALIITHGLSGCGKSFATQRLAEMLGAIRLRSDLERKRLYAIPPLANSAAKLSGGIYTHQATTATYRHLAKLSQCIIKAGYRVIVDATFLKRSERNAFRIIAEEMNVPFIILNVQAPLDVLRARVIARRARGDDPSEADLGVLDHQIAVREPFTPAEMRVGIALDGTRAPSRKVWRPLLARLQSTKT